MLDKNRVLNLSKDILNITKLEDPLGKILNSTNIRPNGLKISKITVPLGLIAVIFESRPNVTSDVAALMYKIWKCSYFKRRERKLNLLQNVL